MTSAFYLNLSVNQEHTSHSFPLTLEDKINKLLKQINLMTLQRNFALVSVKFNTRTIVIETSESYRVLC